MRQNAGGISGEGLQLSLSDPVFPSGLASVFTVLEKIGWGTWIRTRVDGVRVRSGVFPLPISVIINIIITTH
jgi:hypothetical protein